MHHKLSQALSVHFRAITDWNEREQLWFRPVFESGLLTQEKLRATEG